MRKFSSAMTAIVLASSVISVVGPIGGPVPVQAQAAAGAIRPNPGCSSSALPRNDDGSSSAAIGLGFDLRFFGASYSQVWVNNNGNVTFDGPLSVYTPTPISSAGVRMIAPFWADVDTRNTGSAVVTYGQTVVDGRRAFCVNWAGVGVGYYNQQVDKLNKFQLILVDANDDDDSFNIEFNYEQVRWESGSASGGVNGLGGSTARVGMSNGTAGQSFELPGSGVAGSFLDSSSTALKNGRRSSTVNGRYRFAVIGGQPRTETPLGTVPVTFTLSSLFDCADETPQAFTNDDQNPNTSDSAIQITNYTHGSGSTVCNGFSSPDEYVVRTIADGQTTEIGIGKQFRSRFYGDLMKAAEKPGTLVAAETRDSDLAFQTVRFDAPYFAAEPNIAEFTVQVSDRPAVGAVERTFDVNESSTARIAKVRLNRATGDWTVNGTAGHRNFMRGDGTAPVLLTFDVSIEPFNAASPGDTDDDGLLDGWEKFGLVMQDMERPSPLTGPVDTYQLQLNQWGAQTNRQDIFVEFDRDGSKDILADPIRNTFTDIVDAFAAHNINVTFDTGALTTNPATPSPAYGVNLRSLSNDTSAGQLNVVPSPIPCNFNNDYARLKVTSFNSNRRWVFHYMVYGAKAPGTVKCDQSAGGLGEVPGNDVLMYRADAAGYMHELGHNLKLTHGGIATNPNCSPGHMSVMNYSYGYGIKNDGAENANRQLDYSPPRTASIVNAKKTTPQTLTFGAVLPANPGRTITESSIVENLPIYPADPTKLVRWVNTTGFDPTKPGQQGKQENAGDLPVDINNDGDTTDSPVNDAMNHYVSAADCRKSGSETLRDNNDWASLDLRMRNYRSTALALAEAEDIPDESHGGLTLDQQRAEEDALATTDWSVTSTSTANSAGYQVTVTIAQDLKKPVASPVLTIASVGGIQPTEFPTECTVDNDGAFCALAVTTRTVYPITLTFQYPANATQLNLNVDPRGDTELTPANNTTTLNLTSCRVCVLNPIGNGITLQNSTMLLTDGNLVVNSSATNAASLQNSTLRAATGELRITGSYTASANSTTTPNPIVKPAINDPTASLVIPASPPSSTATCTLRGNNSTCGLAQTTKPDGTISLIDGSLATLSINNQRVEIGPGRYGTIDLRGNATLTLRPGSYFIDGTLSETGNSTLNATGVTIYITSDISLAGSSTLTLSAVSLNTPALVLANTTPQQVSRSTVHSSDEPPPSRPAEQLQSLGRPSSTDSH
jgi:hypothetical protein